MSRTLGMVNAISAIDEEKLVLDHLEGRLDLKDVPSEISRNLRRFRVIDVTLFCSTRTLHACLLRNGSSL